MTNLAYTMERAIGFSNAWLDWSMLTFVTSFQAILHVPKPTLFVCC